MAYELRRLETYDDDSLISEIKRVAALIKTPTITQNAFNRLSKASSSAIRRRFGSWEEALSRAGLGDRYSGAPEAIQNQAKARRTFSDDELVSELKFVASRIGEAPVTIEEFSRHSSINPETVRRRFGSWSKALARAGLQISNLGKRYSESEYFENLLPAWTHHGRQPTYGEMAQSPSRITAGAYEARWKTWRNALKAFIEYANGEAPNGTSKPMEENELTDDREHSHSIRPISGTRPPSPAHSQADGRVRAVPLRLRFKVLKRDRFHCVLCGSSPAMKFGCELHVDHIVPFSKGGTAALENLRTLCSDCNIGRGNQDD